MRTYSSVFIVVIVVEVVIEVNASLERYVRLSCSLIIQKEAHLIAMKDSTRKRRALTEYMKLLVVPQPLITILHSIQCIVTKTGIVKMSRSAD